MTISWMKKKDCLLRQLILLLRGDVLAEVKDVHVRAGKIPSEEIICYEIMPKEKQP